MCQLFVDNEKKNVLMGDNVRMGTIVLMGDMSPFSMRFLAVYRLKTSFQNKVKGKDAGHYANFPPM